MLTDGDFNINALDLNANIPSLSEEYKLLVKEPTHVSGSLIDHIYIKKTLLSSVSVNCDVPILYFSDHDACRLELTIQSTT